jgi:hypothetical protein
MELIGAFRCFACRSDTHSAGSCSHTKRCGFAITYCPDNGTRGDRRRTPAAHRADPAAKPPPSDKPPKVEPPKVQPPPVALKIDTPSIPSTKGSDLDNKSDDADFVGWHASSEAAVSTVERHQARQAQASQAHTELDFLRKAQPKARSASARPVHCSSLSFTRRTTGLDSKPAFSAWIPGRLQRALSSKANPSSTVLDPYICIDSGASPDLFPDRSYFTEYTDISHQGHYVIVADDSRIPIHGIGTVHEVILRKVYHVPELNAPLFSIRTHRRRGPGCFLIADHLGCWLTFPTFILDIGDAEDFLLPIAPSDPSSPVKYAEPLSI